MLLFVWNKLWFSGCGPGWPGENCYIKLWSAAKARGKWVKWLTSILFYYISLFSGWRMKLRRTKIVPMNIPPYCLPLTVDTIEWGALEKMVHYLPKGINFHGILLYSPHTEWFYLLFMFHLIKRNPTWNRLYVCSYSRGRKIDISKI